MIGFNIICLFQNNNDEIKLEFSIDHLQISNRIFDNYKFDFPVVLSMEPHQSKTILPNRQQLMKYLSYETNQPSQTNSALTITCVLDQSSCSTPGNFLLCSFNVLISLTKTSLEHF